MVDRMTEGMVQEDPTPGMGGSAEGMEEERPASETSGALGMTLSDRATGSWRCSQCREGSRGPLAHCGLRHHPMHHSLGGSSTLPSPVPLEA